MGIAGIGLLLTACGGGGGGGRNSSPVITNEFLLPGISQVSTQAASSSTSQTKIYVNDVPNTDHEGWVLHVVDRLNPNPSAVIRDYKRDDTEDTFNSFDNYFAQSADTITILPRGIDDKPYQMVRYIDQVRSSQKVSFSSLGLQVISAGMMVSALQMDMMTMLETEVVF